MAKLIEINQISDERGNLCVIEDQIGFDIKRVFYIFGVPTELERGGHGHKVTQMALIALGGACHVHVHNRESIEEYVLDDPSKCLLLSPEDWHTMNNFSEKSTLLVLASEKYDKNDYVLEKPQ